MLASVRIGRFLSLLVCCVSMSWGASAYAAGCYARPYNCEPPGDIDPVTAATYTVRNLAYADLAWQDFIALNFPAEIDATTAMPQPVPSKQNGLNYRDGDYTAVWQTWSEARDLFREHGQSPVPFGAGHTTPALCARLNGEGNIEMSSTIVLDEYIQANRMGPVIDQNGQYVRFGINFNRDMVDYVTNHTLYTIEGQAAFDKNNPHRDKGNVQFLPGVYSRENGKNVGSIFVKSSWKILGATDDPSKFFRTLAFVYDRKGGAFDDEPTVEERCELKTVGLVGLHIVHLTKSAPQWVWATFEHIDNAPWLPLDGPQATAQTYNFFDAKRCASPFSLATCPFNTLPQQPWNPQRAGQVPTQLVRVGAPGQAAIVVNGVYRSKIDAAYGKTVWANYFLADVQFPTINKPGNPTLGEAIVNPAYPDGEPSASFLANSTMESYIPGFTHGSHTQGGIPIAAADQMQIVSQGSMQAVSPFERFGPFGQSGGAVRVTSSCVSCHADATMTTGSNSHFVFSLGRAQHALRAGGVENDDGSRGPWNVSAKSFTQDELSLLGPISGASRAPNQK